MVSSRLFSGMRSLLCWFLGPYYITIIQPEKYIDTYIYVCTCLYIRVYVYVYIIAIKPKCVYFNFPRGH